MKIFRLLFINLLVLVALLLLVEIIFGGWIFHKNDLNNLNIIHNRSYQYNLKGLYAYDKEEIIYSRDKFGFRGACSFNHPEKIDILTIGGSTTDQRYIEDGKTWQDLLQLQLKDSGLHFCIANAGVDGQSTIGHLRNFELWFPSVRELHPQYILFYIGINDFYTIHPSFYDNLEASPRLWKKIKDKSALVHLYRKIKGINSVQQYSLGSHKLDLDNFRYTQTRRLDSLSVIRFWGNRLALYRNRISELINKSLALGAEPVFITQPSRQYTIDSVQGVSGIDSLTILNGYPVNGIDYYYLNQQMNQEIYRAAGNKYLVIDLSNERSFRNSDFYDFIHNTPSGTAKIAGLLAPVLAEKLRSSHKKQ